MMQKREMRTITISYLTGKSTISCREKNGESDSFRHVMVILFRDICLMLCRRNKRE